MRGAVHQPRDIEYNDISEHVTDEKRVDVRFVPEMYGNGYR